MLVVLGMLKPPVLGSNLGEMGEETLSWDIFGPTAP